MLAKREKPVLPLYGELTGCQRLVECQRAAVSMSGAEWGKGGIETCFIKQLNWERQVTWFIWSDCNRDIFKAFGCFPPTYQPPFSHLKPYDSTRNSVPQAFKEARGEWQGTGLRAPAPPLPLPFCTLQSRYSLEGKSGSRKSPIAFLNLLPILLFFSHRAAAGGICSEGK